jgi:hypothetical protein
MNVIKQILPIVSSDPIDGRPVAIYVHGLASGATGTTFSSLAQKLKQVVSDAGYNVLIDSKGVHRITSSTIKLIAKLINKE